MPHWTLCVRFGWDAERPGLHSHAERGNDQGKVRSGKSGNFFGEQIRTRFCRFNSPLIKLT
jgi:hypothetical protein